jgi:hypothetical protein
VDRLLDAVEATVTVGLRQLCCELGIAGRSFARSVGNLKSAAQVAMGEDLFRQVVESEGKAVLQVSADDQLEIDWSASECLTRLPVNPGAAASVNPDTNQAANPDAVPSAGPACGGTGGSAGPAAAGPAAGGDEVSRLYASCDGVLVPTTTAQEKRKRRTTTVAKRQKMPKDQRSVLPNLPTMKKGTDQRYKQIYLSAFYDQSKEHRLVGVTRGDHRALKGMLKRDAARVHLLAAAERVGLVDGAVCLRNNLEGLPLQEILLDFRHLGEHVNDASRKTLGDKTEAGKQWSNDALHTVRHQGYAPFFQKLLDWRTPLRGGKRKAADGLLNYVAPRQEMMAYEKCDPRGWDVGSGPMESMCGVTTDRIKGRGRRWDIDNAEALMALEALQQSNLWEKYWAKALRGTN